MKKLIVAAMVIVAACAMSSCSKTCTCKEKNSGVTSTQKTGGTYSSCSAIQSALNSTGKSLGQSWSCSEKK